MTVRVFICLHICMNTHSYLRVCVRSFWLVYEAVRERELGSRITGVTAVKLTVKLDHSLPNTLADIVSTHTNCFTECHTNAVHYTYMADILK